MPDWLQVVLVTALGLLWYNVVQINSHTAYTRRAAEATAESVRQIVDLLERRH